MLFCCISGKFVSLKDKNNNNMAQAVKVGGFIYRINPNDDRQLQRATQGSSSWSRVTEFNGHHILDILLAANGRDIEVYTDYGLYIREYSGGLRKK